MKTNPVSPRIQIALMVLALITLSACGKSDSEKAHARLTLNNSAAAVSSGKGQADSASVGSTPSSFKVKLMAAYLAEDVDPITQNNLGMNGMFYVNPECGDEDLMRCNVTTGIAEDGLPWTRIITTFFDFAQGNAAVNAALNAQSREIEPGTYRYVRMDFCKYGPGTPNVKWSGGNVSSEREFLSGQCGVTSVAMDPPLVLGEGDSATIQVSYDLSEAIQVGADAYGDDCVGSGTTRTCIRMPHFVPSIVQ